MDDRQRNTLVLGVPAAWGFALILRSRQGDGLENAAAEHGAARAA